MYNLNTNQRAIELYEKSLYAEALAAFELAVEESRTVQSLTNLAWFYYHEEGKSQQAEELLAEALQMTPSSHFPFSLSGEIYVEQKEWEKAYRLLLQSIQLTPTTEAFHNLAIASYYLGKLEEAAAYFRKGSKSVSDYSMYNHVKCLIELGRVTEAKVKLDAFDENDGEFAGSVEVAELYLEMKLYREAAIWFQKGWGSYYKQPGWVEGYIYSLFKLNQIETAEQLLREVMEEKQQDIQDSGLEECDETWTLADKTAYIEQLNHELSRYESLLERVSSDGYTPKVEFTPSLYSGCYLFGCMRHNHAPYGQSQE